MWWIITLFSYWMNFYSHITIRFCLLHSLNELIESSTPSSHPHIDYASVWSLSAFERNCLGHDREHCSTRIATSFGDLNKSFSSGSIKISLEFPIWIWIVKMGIPLLHLKALNWSALQCGKRLKCCCTWYLHISGWIFLTTYGHTCVDQRTIAALNETNPYHHLYMFDVVITHTSTILNRLIACLRQIKVLLWHFGYSNLQFCALLSIQIQHILWYHVD